MKFSEILLTAGIASVVTLGTLYVAGRFLNARREDVPEEEAETTAEVEEFEEVPMKTDYIYREADIRPADTPSGTVKLNYYDKPGRKTFKNRVKDWAAEKLVNEIEKRDISITIHLKKD